MFLQPTENNNTETAGGGLMVVINVEPYSRWPGHSRPPP
jgi:hypothetical protein